GSVSPSGGECSAGADSDALVEELIFQCLEDEDVPAALARACDAHPGLAARLRRAVARVQGDALLAPLSSTAARGGPPGTGGMPGDLSEIPDRLGSFRLLTRLGAGGMGVVYEAEDEELGRRVAIKLIRPDQLYVPGSRAR